MQDEEGKNGDNDDKEMSRRKAKKGRKGKYSRWWKSLLCFGRRKSHILTSEEGGGRGVEGW